MNSEEEARKLRNELLPRYIDRLVALDKLASLAIERWPEIEWYHMVRMDPKMQTSHRHRPKLVSSDKTLAVI